jgi:transcriptional repressor NrdR
MKCPFCSVYDSKVTDSRTADDGLSIRRRRECIECGKRFTTYEKIELQPVLVIKQDNTRQNFCTDKLKRGLRKACEKRPVSAFQIDTLVQDIEKQIQNSLNQEVNSKQIGELVMDGLKRLDEVSYIRFASVHRKFTDLDTLHEAIAKLKEEKNKL